MTSTQIKTKTPLYKQPAFIILALFIAGFFVLQHFAQNMVSDEPLVLKNGNPPQIIMFGTANCGYCIIAKAFFRKHKLPFTEYDIERSKKHMNTFYRLGGRGTPLLIINKEIIHGYDERRIRKAL